MGYLGRVIALSYLVACGDPLPAYCRGRVDDADCDGVPDGVDLCPGSDAGALHDAAGCTEAQAAGCTVELSTPEDGAALQGETRFAWLGTCDAYALQFADDPSFPPGATRTAANTEATEVIASGRERYWRVVGGQHGASMGYAAPPRLLVTP